MLAFLKSLGLYLSLSVYIHTAQKRNNMSIFLEILKCLLCCEEEYHDRGRNRRDRNYYEESSPSYNTFVSPSNNYPVPQSDPQTVVSIRDTSFTRIGPSSTSSVRPTTPYVPPRVHTSPPRAPPRVPTTPHIPPRVPVIPVLPIVPPRAVIDPWRSDGAESMSLSSSASCPPPSSSSSKSSVKPPPSSSSKQSTPKPTSSVSKFSPSSSGLSTSSLKSALPLFKPTLAPAPTPSISANQQGRTYYTQVEKASSPIYVIPKDIADLIKKDTVPSVLKRPLSPSTYKDYFGALLYAEDFYIEKWNNYLLNNVTLELHKASIYRRDRNIFHNESEDKTFVAFEVDSVPERRPFLLSRDFVFLQPSGRKIGPFQGVIYRVVNRNTVLVEFEEDFYSEHYPDCKYNVSFSFNRFCLKRAHQAVKAASDPAFQSFLFPDCIDRNLNSPTSFSFTHKLDLKQADAVFRILGINSAPPYLVEGPLSVLKNGELSKTGSVVQEAIVHIYCTSPNSRILVCAPTNNTCDVLMRNLKKKIREFDMFRANAAFRELDGVPVDVLPSCRYRDECFTCPSLQELRKFKVVLSTFVSGFRLHGEGIAAGHFSHIFLVDASSIIEPEMMVALANLANENTAVVVTGAPKNRSSWVRSDIARKNGLRISYFERLRESKPYNSLNPRFISQLEDACHDSYGTYSIR